MLSYICPEWKRLFGLKKKGRVIMSLQRARRYIEQLHKRQDNPYLWPDYLTGLPDQRAVVKKLSDIFPKIGRYAICYLRIANIEPYLMKYGYDKHAEIIQWAAAILKSVAIETGQTFVGKAGTHEFVVIIRPSKISDFIKKANSLLRRKSRAWYNQEDLKRGFIFTYQDASGEERQAGLLKFVCAYVDSQINLERMELLPYLKNLCRKAETEDRTVLRCS
ncbi:MAG: GGDEF domain-containing protein [Nitrospirae bacterium]|nr:MAG: GGDEF domain-containing protein [Nitrospirota bacterium]